ncbi:MAG: flagellar basal body-associated protein FliL [Gammaproteobacteria bacterium]|nr:MAG: flagellar basal body-associated protein FliL [Gammaproteobacteria bacterium]
MATNVDDLDLDLDDGDQPQPKSKSKLLIIIVVVVLLLGISVTATLMLTGILSGDEEVIAEQSSETDGKAEKSKKDKKDKKKKAKAPLNYVPLDPPFVVNFIADTDIRFLQITVEAGTREAEAVEQIKEHRPAIRNSLVMLFSSQDPFTLNTREGKEQLRAETLAEIQKVLKEETGKTVVESVFFTSFVMQ